MKQFNDLNQLVAFFERNACDAIDPDDEHRIKFVCQLVNCKMTIRCVNKRADILARAKKLKADFSKDHTTGYKAWVKASNEGRIKSTKRAPFSNAVVKAFNADEDTANAVAYLQAYGRPVYFPQGYPKFVLTDVEATTVDGFVVAKSPKDGSKFSVWHTRSGLRAGIETVQKTKASALAEFYKILETKKDLLERALKSANSSTFLEDRLKELSA